MSKHGEFGVRLVSVSNCLWEKHLMVYSLLVAVLVIETHCARIGES